MFPYKLLIPEVGRGEKRGENLSENIATAKVLFSRNHMYDVLHWKISILLKQCITLDVFLTMKTI